MRASVKYAVCSVFILGCAKARVPQTPEAQKFATSPIASNAALPSPPPVSTKLPLVHPTRIAPEGVFAVRAVRLFDGETLIENATVVVRGDRIEAVGVSAAIPAGATVIDGQGKTLLPGLIDAHTHAFNEEQLEQAVVAGVTTELDMMGAPAFARRMKEEAWGSPRADLFAAGDAMTAPKGHGTQYGRDVPTLGPGADGAAFANARIDEGSDFLKIVYDHFRPTVSAEQIRAAVQAAGARGKLAVAHTLSVEEASTAVHAGVDALVHLWYYPGRHNQKQVSPETLRLMVEQGAFVIPTLQVLYSICGRSRGETVIADPALSPYVATAALGTLQDKFRFSPPICQDLLKSVSVLKQHGVTILAGTDAPNPGIGHGVSLHDELALLQEAGLSALEILAAATSKTADAFVIPDRGRIAPGKLADLVLVAGDPTHDVRATRDIVAVWKNGWPVARAAWAERVARQRAARAKAAPGAIGDFETGDVDSAFGAGLAGVSDAYAGGKSFVRTKAAEGGARATMHFLDVSGEVMTGRPENQYAGVTFFPGSIQGGAADLSRFSTLVFFAKGDAQAYQVSLHDRSGGWGKPVTRTFVTSANWQEYRFKLSDFGRISSMAIIGIFWGRFAPGRFALQLDEIRLE